MKRMRPARQRNRETLHMGTLLGAAALCLTAASLALGTWQSDPPPEFQEDAQSRPPDEAVGERPYEMVRAGRTQPHVPLLDFDSLEGWTLQGWDGARGELLESQGQRVWESPVAKLIYRGSSEASRLTLRPPRPIPVPGDATAVTIWIFGNNWGWLSDPSTPRVEIVLYLSDQSGKTHTLSLTKVRWKEWWLVHKVLPPPLREAGPLRLAGIGVLGCGNTENRELYFEDLVFFRESPAPLVYGPRPRRGVEPFPGQPQGANTGPGRLPFPTREETILPTNYERDFKVGRESRHEDLVLTYWGPDANLEYVISPREPFFRNIAVRLNGEQVAKAWSGAGPVFSSQPEEVETVYFRGGENDSVEGRWKVRVAGSDLFVDMTARLWQKSLVLDTIGLGGEILEVSYGAITGVSQPELLLLPFLNYGSHHLNVLMSKGPSPFFSSVWMDWYRSNASQPYAEDSVDGSSVRLNGGVRYKPTTEGKRNDVYERVFITFSPMFEEILPTIPNPAAKRGKEAGTRLWQESWGPEDYAVEHERSRRLRAYGIERLTQCNHEISWRDSGESFTFRSFAAPAKGGDEALREYVANQRALGWRSGLYTNYTDYAPVNSNWDTDQVMRDPEGNLITAWPRCYSPKALFAVEMDRKLAPFIQKKFNSNAAYTDVHTAVSPWDRCDYDARVPGAATFAATFYAYGEILLHDQDVYDGHCWSEGNHQWLYAGLTTGNYGLTYSELKLWQYPYLPHFDLLKIHPLSVDIGVPWTQQFFHGNDTWRNDIESSIDQFLAATIAYGHMGWLVEEAHGIRQTCRSYYMLQQLQSRYLMEQPETILYGTENGMVTSSEAFRTGAWRLSRLFIRYANGVEIWVNGNASQPWTVTSRRGRFELPPYGWLALQGSDFFSGSVSSGASRYDFLSSPEYLFLDGRGQGRNFAGVETSGSVAVRRSPTSDGLSLIFVEGEAPLRLSLPGGEFGPMDVRTRLAQVISSAEVEVTAFDVDERRVGEKRVTGERQGIVEIPLFDGAVRYEVVPVPPGE